MNVTIAQGWHWFTMKALITLIAQLVIFCLDILEKLRW